jgi:hypothetical protein
LLYGTIVSAAALAVGAGRGETAFGMDEAMVTTLIVYWLAHIYTKTVSERRPGSATPLHRLLRHSAGQESTILVGGLPAVILTTAMALAHLSVWPTVLAVLCTAIVVLVVEGALAGTSAGGARLAARRGGGQRRGAGRHTRGAASLPARALTRPGAGTASRDHGIVVLPGRWQGKPKAHTRSARLSSLACPCDLRVRRARPICRACSLFAPIVRCDGQE